MDRDILRICSTKVERATLSNSIKREQRISGEKHLFLNS